MTTEAPEKVHRGVDFRDFLAGEGILPEVEVLGLKRVVALQLQQILEQEHITKTELASRMKTSRASLDRMLDPQTPRSPSPASEKPPLLSAGKWNCASCPLELNS